MTIAHDRVHTDRPPGAGVVNSAAPKASPPRGRVRRVLRGPDDAPAWMRPALPALLLATAVLYLWNLSASGYANTFYSAAVQAGSQSWKAWFFGSLDSSNFITVDKPPASLWVMGLSARVFGFSSWSVLAPQALMAVASVGLLFGAIRRSFAQPAVGYAAGLLAGAILALTPAAALMFRFNNPDALLVLTMTIGAYGVTRALEGKGARWLVFAGAALGLAFLTKMLQGLLVLPAFGGVYLLCAAVPLRRRLLHVAAMVLALVVAAGWWVAAVALWPASSRPYIGGSTDNSVINLMLGYNGLGRIFGQGGGGGNGAAGSSFGGATGLTRLVGSEMGLEVSWLLPVALVALALGVAATAATPRTDRTRAAVLLWGGWLLVTGMVFSYMSGTIHPYYTVALAPAIAALIALGGGLMWRRRHTVSGCLGLAALATTAAAWGTVLLARSDFGPVWLRWSVLVLGVAASATVVLGRVTGVRRLVAAGVLAALLSGLGGTAAYTVATASTAHTGSIPTAVATSADGTGGGGAGGPGGGTGQPAGPAAGGAGAVPGQSNGGIPSGASASGASASESSTAGTAANGSDLAALLRGSTTRWSAAVNGSQQAAQLELSSGSTVLAIGGWSSDPAPTLAQFIHYVETGQVHYYVSGGQGGGPGGGSGTASQISAWVQQHFTARTVGSSTVYDLSGYTG